MHGYNPTVLSAVDYARLQGMMCTLIGSQTPLAALLRCKLESVAIVRRSDAGPDVVTVERTIRFRINDRDREERKLVWPAAGTHHTDPLLLFPREARGLALLGLTVGRSIAYGTRDGQREFLTVERVLSDEDRSSLPPPQERSAHLARLLPSSHPPAAPRDGRRKHRRLVRTRSGQGVNDVIDRTQ